MPITPDTPKENKTLLQEALFSHGTRMALKNAQPEEVPADFSIPTYNENLKPLYDGQLFPKISSAEDLLKVGYATPDGEPTEEGRMAISLKNAGGLNADYTLNDTGKAMLASPEDLLKEENIGLRMQSKAMKLDPDDDTSTEDTLKKLLADLGKGVARFASLTSAAEFPTAGLVIGGGFPVPKLERPRATAAERPAAQAEGRLGIEESIKGYGASAGALPAGFSKIMEDTFIRAFTDGADQDLALAYADQAYDRSKAEFEKAKLSDLVENITGIGTLAEQRAKDEALLGQKKVQEITEGARSLGNIASMINPIGPEMLTAKVGFQVAQKGVGAAFKPISRAIINAEKTANMAVEAGQRVNGLNRQLAYANHFSQAAETQAVFAERQADKLSRMGVPERAAAARNLADSIRKQGQEAGVRVQGITDELGRATAEAAELSGRAGVADNLLLMADKAKFIPGAPIQAAGYALSGLGAGMIKLDKGLSNLAGRIGIDKAYNALNKVSSLAGLGGAGAALGLGPIAFIPAAVKTAWATAPYLKAAGNFTRIVGRETANARGQIPFWQRVANHSELGISQRAISHLMDTATIGSRVTGATGRVVKGMAASYPVDLAFEWVSDAGKFDESTLKNALAETIVFGGTGAALGGITAGSKERIQQLQRGDARNFYRALPDARQRIQFSNMGDGMQRSIGTYSASFPNLNIRFVEQGGGAFDRANNTAYINPNAKNSLKPLLAHEINHYLLVRNQMEGGIAASLVGDGVQTGGLLRSKDGKLDPDYELFKKEYMARLTKQHENRMMDMQMAGMKLKPTDKLPPKMTDSEMAVEYFVDMMADDMLGMAESGELGKRAGRMLVTRKMQAFSDSILQKAPIIKDLFYKMGGVTDKQGKVVYGNSLVANGIKELPEMKRLFRTMINESAGRPMHVAKVTKGESAGHKLPISGKDDPILGEMTSMWESDQYGVPYRDSNGDYIPLSRATDELRGSAGLILAEDQQTRLDRGESLGEGELKYSPEDNTWTGTFLTDRQLSLLRASGRLNPIQLEHLDMLNEAARENKGRRFHTVYQAATGKKKKGKGVDYKTLDVSMREFVPYGIKITKDGNILVQLMSVQQLHANAFEKATSKRGQLLYEGDAEAILRDVNAVIQLHGANDTTDAYFKQYGAQWQDKKNFINAVFGNVGSGQKDMNPLLASEKANKAVVKTYRIDRMNKVVDLEGRALLPYQNHLVKVNYLPEGNPILDQNGEAVDLRYTPSYENKVEETSRIPTQQGLTADQQGAVQAEAGTALRESKGQEGQVNFMPDGMDEQGFYSQLNRVIMDKVPARASIQQIMATIDPTRGSGVKADEIKWSGIEQALKSLEKDGKVSKEDLLNYLRNEGNVRFEEVILGERKTRVEGFSIAYKDGSTIGSPYATREEAQAAIYDMFADRPDIEVREGSSFGLQTQPAKFSQYVLPGGENYREVVLAMPNSNQSKLDTMTRAEMVEWYQDQVGYNIDEDDGSLSDNEIRKMIREYVAEAGTDMLTGTSPVSGYTSSHFPDIPNYVAHMRTNERTDANGMEGLFVEEFQSDRHQAGRKKGYNELEFQIPANAKVHQLGKESGDGQGLWVIDIPTQDGKFDRVGAGKTIEEARKNALGRQANAGKVADAPFRTTWPLQMFKRALRDAVSSEKDWIGWTTGETQNDRFDLSKQIDTIDVQTAPNGDKEISLMPKGDASAIMIEADKDGNIFNSSENFEGKLLEDVIGKDLANKVLQTKNGELSGDDLKMGGSGMKGFYDNMLPKEIQKYVKQWGGKVEKTDLVQSSEADIMSGEEAETGSISIWRVDITPEMRGISQSGQMMYMPEGVTTYIGENSDYAKPPSDEDARNALSSSKRQFFGEHRRLKEGEDVGVRIDIPAYLNNGVYVQTVHEAATPSNVGERIGYDASVRLKGGVRFFVKQGSPESKLGALAIYEGRANKHPIATVEGKFSRDRSIPKDINSWTPVGTDPKKHSYFYDKRTGIPVVSGGESYSVGNTVFVKDPVYGERKDFNYLPAPINPAAPKVSFRKPLSRTDKLPDIDSTLINGEADINTFAFDKPAKVYMTHPNGSRTYFNYDPAYLVKPEFKDLRNTLAGNNVIILEADRMRATGGDMGGPLHPFLRSNQVTVMGDDGQLYKAVWANMTSTFVTGTKNRWFNDKAKYALIHIMDPTAHASNKRIARAIHEAWMKANLSDHDKQVVAVAMQAAITSQEKASFNTKITQANTKISDGGLSKAKVDELKENIKEWLKERDSLSWIGLDKSIAQQISQIKSAQTRLQNKKGTQQSVDAAKQRFVDFLAEKPSHAAAFKALSQKSTSMAIADNIGNTFQSRGAAIKGLMGIVAGSFNPSDILSKTEDFKGSENMDIVGAVQLSKNKDIFAVYFGKDPKEEAAMSASERKVRNKMRKDPNFVEHEAFDWMMLGPANADNFLATSSLKPEELLPEYRSKHPKASVKNGSEETVLGAMKKFGDIPLSVMAKTKAQIAQIEKNRKAWLAARKAEEDRKKKIRGLNNKIKTRDSNIEKWGKIIRTSQDESIIKSFTAKSDAAITEKQTLADQIKKLQTLK